MEETRAVGNEARRRLYRVAALDGDALRVAALEADAAAFEDVERRNDSEMTPVGLGAGRFAYFPCSRIVLAC